MLEYENHKKNKLIEENINKLGERMYKPEVKKLELVEKILHEYLTKIERARGNLISNFYSVKGNIQECVQKSSCDDNQYIGKEIPSFVEVVNRVVELEKIVNIIFNSKK